jgi:NADPH:quinone reductase-like Zn-dependent oxidoreductase
MTAGETVLVHAAAGGLGIMAVQIAAATGCQVIGTAGTDEKCAYVKQYGATACINYTKENWWELVNKETDGKGVDLVFDPVGLVDRSLKCIAHRGRIVVVGFAGTEGKIETIAMNRILLKQVSLIGYVS